MSRRNFVSVDTHTCRCGEWALYMSIAESYDLFDEGIFVPASTLCSCAARRFCFPKRAFVICLPDGQGEIAGTLGIQIEQLGLLLFGSESSVLSRQSGRTSMYWSAWRMATASLDVPIAAVLQFSQVSAPQYFCNSVSSCITYTI